MYAHHTICILLNLNKDSFFSVGHRTHTHKKTITEKNPGVTNNITIVQLSSSVPVIHDNVTVDKHAQ